MDFDYGVINNFFSSKQNFRTLFYSFSSNKSDVIQQKNLCLSMASGGIHGHSNQSTFPVKVLSANNHFKIFTPI